MEKEIYKIKHQDYNNKIWDIIIEFEDKRELRCLYNPKKDEADWKWLNDKAGSINEMNDVKEYIVHKLLIPRMKKFKLC